MSDDYRFAGEANDWIQNKPVFRSKLISVHNRYSIDAIDSARRMFSRPPSGEVKRGNLAVLFSF